VADAGLRGRGGVLWRARGGNSALKASFEQDRVRVQHAIDELSAAGIDDVTMRISLGPASYLFGEESAMLEVVEGRQPFSAVGHVSVAH